MGVIKEWKCLSEMGQTAATKTCLETRAEQAAPKWVGGLRMAVLRAF